MNRSKPLTTRKPLSRGTAQLARTQNVRPVSKRRQKARQSAEGQAGLAYMRAVKMLPCVACGRPGPNDAHHCKDTPPDGKPGLYDRLPAAGRKSGDRDTIPLCPEHHRAPYPDAYHTNRTAWAERHGPDYSHIGPTRAAVAALTEEIEF